MAGSPRRSTLFFLLSIFILTSMGAAAQGVITTVAGTGLSFPNQALPAMAAPLGQIRGIALDAQGNLYLADSSNSLIWKVDSRGLAIVFAGNGTVGFSGDGGPATSASLSFPNSVMVDSAGDVFLADTGNNRLRKVTPAGIISTVAGNGILGFLGDGGKATSASLNINFTAFPGTIPVGMAIDSAGNLWFTDSLNNRVRKVAPNGIITTLAGNGDRCCFNGAVGDNPVVATSTPLYPVGLVMDAAGNPLINDYGGTIRKLTPDGMLATVGTGGGFGLISLDLSGNLLVASGQRVLKVTLPSASMALAGGASAGFLGDGGPAQSALLNFPSQAISDSAGNIFIADTLNFRVRKITLDGVINTVAGSGASRFSGEGGLALSASLNGPAGVALDPMGNVIVADTLNERIRKITREGFIVTVAGNGVEAFAGDGGKATSAALSSPIATASDQGGNLFIADATNSRVRKVSPDGNISTVLGGGFGVAVEASGNLIATDGLRIYRVTPSGMVTLIAGGSQGKGGDGGPATDAHFSLIKGLGADSLGSIYIADTQANRIRKITPDGIINAVAGNDVAPGGFSGDNGPATLATLNGPTGVAVDQGGNIYIADAGNNRIRVVTPDGIIRTFAGNGIAGLAGDGGIATAASLSKPSGVAVDSGSNILIADTGNSRIRKILARLPAAKISPTQLVFQAASGGGTPPAQVVGFTGDIPGLSFSASADSFWLHVNPPSGASPSLLDVTADPTGLQPGTYTSSIQVTAPNSLLTETRVTVTFVVTSATTAQLVLDRESLSYPFPKTGRPRSQAVRVSNAGSGTLTFTASTATATGGGWLTVAPPSGQALPSSPAALTVTADPTGLAPGTYTGSLTVTAAGAAQTIPVIMTINSFDQALLLSQSGLSFLGISQGGVVPPQTFGVANIGSGGVNWTVSKSTLSGGPDWLRVTPASGTSDAAASTVPVVTVSVDPSILPAGKYYGLVRVDAPNAANSPQVLTVSLQVLPPGSDIGAVTQPAEVSFFTSASQGSPGSKDLFLYNVAAAPKSFRSLVSADPGLRVVTLPSDGTLDPQQPTRVVVQPFTEGLAPGTYNGSLTIQFDDGLVRSLKFSVVVSAGSANLTPGARSADAACSPTKLLPSLVSLGQSFTVSAGWPVALGVDVIDDCGNPLETGSVIMSFSTGDAPLSLASLKGGRWDGTWNTASDSLASAVLKLQAQSADGQLSGAREISGKLQSQTDPPVFQKKNILSAAGGNPFDAIGPGSIISIFGDRLATGIDVAQSAPLPLSLLDTSVLIAGRNLPLYFVSPNQLNALVPSGLNANTSYQVLVQRGTTYSLPVAVDVAPAQPSIFRDTSVSPDQGFIIAVRGQGASQTQLEAKPGTPAHTGDTVVIYADGLGAVNPPVADGTAAGSPLSITTNAVQVHFSDVAATPVFAGLAPGFVGLYQVNVVVPSGVPSGSAVPVTLTAGGQTGAPATLAIE